MKSFASTMLNEFLSNLRYLISEPFFNNPFNIRILQKGILCRIVLGMIGTSTLIENYL